MTSSLPYLASLHEEERLRALEVKITWPDGRIQEKLTGPQRWLHWEHAHRGHDTHYQDCYSCACEDAY